MKDKIISGVTANSRGKSSERNREGVVAQGAEAIILKENNFIIKDRIPKSYRLKELDIKIRKHRTKSEKNLLEKASKIINAPNPFPLEEFDKIKMPLIEGKRLSENMDSFSLEKQKQICRIIGEEISKLHDADIIHGDLTTSNMILVDESENKLPFPEGGRAISRVENIPSRAGGRELASEVASWRGISNVKPIIFFIDFGLGYISPKVEDKAVDLHLLKQALEAKHFRNWEVLFNEVKKGYENSKDSKKILERLIAVEKRGRYKGE
jgi:tRNA A-37 threonylcarbamoyl transferase component Bud32